MNRKFSLYDNIYSDKPQVFDVEKTYKWITENEKDYRAKATKILKEQGKEAFVKFKKSLPSATFAAMFKGARRQQTDEDKSKIIPSGYVIEDLDNLEENTIKSIESKFSSDSKLVLAFKSPSSKGYKLLYQAPTTIESYKDWWFTVANHVNSFYGVECDPSGKDITRGCWLINDENAYFNKNAESFIESEKLMIAIPGKNESKINPENCKNHLPKLSKAKDIIERYINKAGEALQNTAPGEKNNTLFSKAALIGGYAWTGLIDFDEVKKTFKNYLVQREGDTTSDSEFDATFLSGWNSGINSPREITTFYHNGLEFICAWDGLYYSQYKTNKTESYWTSPKKISENPVWVVGITHDSDGTNCGKYLKWLDGAKKERYWAMPLSLTQGESTELFKNLSDANAIVEPELQKYFIKYLMFAPSKNEYICTDSVGWLDGDTYVLPGKAISSKSDKKVILQSENYISDLKATGTFEAWQEASKLITNNSRFVLALSMAFAAPLLGLVPNSFEGGGVNLIGASGGGKTTALQIAASVWGNPNTNAEDSFIVTWDSTKNAYESICYSHNHCLLPLDEMGQCDKATIGKTVYMLSNGQPKNRMNKNISLRKRKPWKLLFLSTGEKNLSQIMSEYGGEKAKEGQLIRLADIPSDAGYNMGMVEQLNGCSDSKEFVRKIQNTVIKNYGFAGVKFIKKVLEDKEKVFDKVEFYRDNFAKWVGVEKDSDACRVADRFALIAAAGELATEFGITGWVNRVALEGVKRCFYAWYSNHGGSNRAKADFLKKLHLFLSNHYHEFTCYSEIYGKASENEFFIKRDFFENTFCWSEEVNPRDPLYKYHTDIPYNNALKVLKEAGILVASNDGKSTKPIRFGFSGDTHKPLIRVIAIKKEFLSAEVLPNGLLFYDSKSQIESNSAI